MEEIFNLGEIDKNILTMINELCILSMICKKYIIDPNEENGNAIVEDVEKVGNNFSALKENIVQMITDLS
ncbi:MAG: hypothetical protein WC942_10335 [Clostridia bacterium]|jgi:hypothetical protein